MKKHYWKNCIALLLPLSLLLTGCGKGSTDEADPDSTPGTIVGQPLADSQAADGLFSLTYSPDDSVNPYSGSCVVNETLSGLLYESLFTVASDFTFAPTRLISSYESTDGGQNWRFTVNTEVQFSDGTHLTAEDAVSSIRCAMQSDRFRSRLSNFTVIMGISAMDEETFFVSLYTADLLFPSLLTIPILQAGNYKTPCPLGTGLYKMEGAEHWNSAEETTEDDETEAAPAKEAAEPKLVLNPLHPRAKDAALTEICLRPQTDIETSISDFEVGLIDLMENDPTGISAVGHSSSNEVRSYVVPSMYYLGFNMGHSFVQVPQYRYAISYLVDRQTIVDKVMAGNGEAAVSPVSPTCLRYDSSIDKAVHYAPQSALDLLARGGCEDHDDDGKLEYLVTGIPMEISLDFIVCSSNPVKVSVARNIAASLQSIGITVTLRELVWEDYLLALTEGEFDMYMAEVILPADFDLRSLLTEDGALNYGGVTDIGYAQRIAAYLAADDSGRAAACSNMCQYIVANSPIIPIAFESRDVITHRGVISGIELSPYNIFYNIADWKVDLSSAVSESAE